MYKRQLHGEVTHPTRGDPVDVEQNGPTLEDLSLIHIWFKMAQLPVVSLAILSGSLGLVAQVLFPLVG